MKFFSVVAIFGVLLLCTFGLSFAVRVHAGSKALALASPSSRLPRLLPTNATVTDDSARFGDDPPPPFCDSSLYCNANSTCCLLDNGDPGCFNGVAFYFVLVSLLLLENSVVNTFFWLTQGVNDTCCGVENSACPNGYGCDPVKGDCYKIDTTTAYCKG